MTNTTKPAWHAYHNDSVHKGGEHTHPGWRPADNKHGLAFYCPWDDPYSGFPEHSRRLVRALANTDVPVHMRQLRGGLNIADPAGHDKEKFRAAQRIREEFKSLIQASIKSYDVEIFMTIAHDQAFQKFGGPVHHYMTPEQLVAVQARRIVSTVFERDRLSKMAAECLKRVGRVWVANQQDKAMLLEQGLAEDHVVVVPIPFYPDDPHLELRDKPRRVGVPRFYHIGKWEPRKEHRNILGAFMLAFEPEEAKLFVKTSLRGPALKSGYPMSAPEAIAGWLADERVKKKGWNQQTVNQNIFIIQRRLSASQMLTFHRQSDVYVSLSRGEGFDMPAYDAVLSGNHLVYTESGGPQDFAGRYDSRVRVRGKVPCDPFYQWGDAQYGDYLIGEAVHAMRRSFQAVKDRVTPTWRDGFEETFSAARIGALMRDSVEELR